MQNHNFKTLKYYTLSLSTIVLNSRNRPKKQWCPPLKPMLGYRLCEKKSTKMYWYHYNDTVPFRMPLKFRGFIQYIILNISKLSSISSA